MTALKDLKQSGHLLRLHHLRTTRCLRCQCICRECINERRRPEADRALAHSSTQESFGSNGDGAYAHYDDDDDDDDDA